MSRSFRLSVEAEAVLVKAKHALVADHEDLVDGVAEIDRLISSADRNDPGAIMLLTGASGSGKTTIVRRSIEEYKVRLLRETGRSAILNYQGLLLTDGASGDERPIVFVNTPSSRSMTALASAILQAYGAEVPRQLRKHQILARLRAQIVGQKTKILVLDEFHHAVDDERDRIVLELSELVKDILVETRVQIVLVGMGHAALPVDRNPQLDRRCSMRFPIGPMGWGAEPADQQPFRTFLGKLEASMALPSPSHLDDPDRAGRIHRATGGIIGYVSRLVLGALERGLERGISHVDDACLAFIYDQTKVTGDETNPFREALPNRGPTGTGDRRKRRRSGATKPAIASTANRKRGNESKAA